MKTVEGRHFIYAVTARHVIDGIKGLGLQTASLRVNLKNGDAAWIETDVAHWDVHPAGPTVDVAVLRRSFLFDRLDHLLFPLSAAATDEVIAQCPVGIGDEVFVAGLFANHYGRRRNIPIVRIGNIASMPEEPVSTRLGFFDAFLIEARSSGGLSGLARLRALWRSGENG